MPSIVVGDFFRRGAAPTAFPPERAWQRGDIVERLAMYVSDDHIDCDYTRSVGRAIVEQTEFVVDVSWSSCNYGGRRPWLHCTEEECGRRSARLYLRGSVLVCRACANARYRSQ